METTLKHGLDYPRTNTQEILYTLISTGKVSIFDYPYLSGFRTRISELRQHLNIETIKDLRCNKFGNQYAYAIHILPKGQIEKSISLYKKMQQNKSNI